MSLTFKFWFWLSGAVVSITRRENESMQPFLVWKDDSILCEAFCGELLTLMEDGHIIF